MPPFGADEKGQAIHLLAAVGASRRLVAAVQRAGGPESVSADAVRAELTALCDTVAKLCVYEARGKARGTITDLSSERLADAVTALERAPELSLAYEEALDLTPEEEQTLFTADGLTEHGKQDQTDPAPPDDEGVFEL